MFTADQDHMWADHKQYVYSVSNTDPGKHKIETFVMHYVCSISLLLLDFIWFCFSLHSLKNLNFEKSEFQQHRN